MNRPIEDRERPPRPGVPFDPRLEPKGPPLFRVPLPAGEARSRLTAPPYVAAASVGLAVTAINVVASRWEFGASLLMLFFAASLASNLFAAAARTWAPKGDVVGAMQWLVAGAVVLAGSSLIQGGNLVGLIIVFFVASLAWRFVGVLTPFLLGGARTPAAALWRAVLSAALLSCVVLPRRLAPAELYYVAFLPAVGANLWLALAAGRPYARYLLAEPRLTVAEAGAGERGRLASRAFPWAAASAVAALAAFAPAALGRLGVTGDAALVAAAFFAAAPPALLVFGSRPYALYCAGECLTVWCTYDVHGAAGPATFRFQGALADAARRRRLFGGVLAVNMLAARLLARPFDAALAADGFGPLVWAAYLAYFFLPLLAPLAATLLVNGAAHSEVRVRIIRARLEGTDT